jgi:mono/diheme cytochrome c family protein
MVTGVLIFCSVISCSGPNTEKTKEFFPDMAETPAYEFFEKKETTFYYDRQKPENVTAQSSMNTHPLVKTESNADSAANSLVNPIESSRDNMNRGAYLYNEICSQCHGENGDGNGFLYQTNAYNYPPADLTEETVVAKKDGRLYHSISVGFGMMGPHQGIVNSKDRWHILLYLRNELQYENGEAE